VESTNLVREIQREKSKDPLPGISPLYNILQVRAELGTITAAITTPILAATTLPAAAHYARDCPVCPRQDRQQESLEGPGSRRVISGRGRDQESGP
jgi:hypothetical protein